MPLAAIRQLTKRKRKGEKSAIFPAVSFCERLAISAATPHVKPMNRREFSKSLAAAATVPALPISALPARAASESASSIRWAAIYISGIQDKCTPQMVSQITGLGPQAAEQTIRQLVAEKLITPAQASGHVTIGSAFSRPQPKPIDPVTNSGGLNEGVDKIDSILKHRTELDPIQSQPSDDQDLQETPDEQA